VFSVSTVLYSINCCLHAKEVAGERIVYAVNVVKKNFGNLICCFLLYFDAVGWVTGIALSL